MIFSFVLCREAKYCSLFVLSYYTECVAPLIENSIWFHFFSVFSARMSLYLRVSTKFYLCDSYWNCSHCRIYLSAILLSAWILNSVEMHWIQTKSFSNWIISISHIFYQISNLVDFLWSLSLFATSMKFRSRLFCINFSVEI